MAVPRRKNHFQLEKSKPSKEGCIEEVGLSTARKLEFEMEEARTCRQVARRTINSWKRQGFTELCFAAVRTISV